MESTNNEIIDIDLDVESILSEDEERWEELIDEIMAGNVIPVIGPDFQIEDEKNFHTQLIDFFAKKFGVTSRPETFSQLIHDKDKKFLSAFKKPEAIYKLINQALQKANKKPSHLLLKLLGTKKFPFVITTSFTPTVENVMKLIWEGEEVKVLQFRNDSKRDKLPGIGDVQSIKQMSEPTVFYMFGKFSEEKHRYVVTDVDMMNFCKSWLAEGNTPETLTSAIKSRYLLVLGNNYSDWLFRFICYSLRSSPEGLRSSLMVNPHADADNPLIQFLNRLETFIQNDPEFVVKEIERRIHEREMLDATESKKQKFKTDVFLSYSRSDKNIVNQLYESLSKRGLRVWYDCNAIKEADKWRKAVINGVRTTRLFVPILTSNIENEIMEAHEYRTEWKEASSMSNKYGGWAFIMPVAENGFDFYDTLTDVPDEFSERNAVWFDATGDFESIADVIERKVTEIKDLEKEVRHHGKVNI